MSYRKIQQLAAEDPHCHYCRRAVVVQRKPTSEVAGTIDHKHPISRGGSNGPTNLLLACFRCNTWKGNMEYAEFVALITKMPRDSHPHYAPRSPRRRTRVRMCLPESSRARKRRATRLRAKERAKYIEEIGRYPVVRDALVAAGLVAAPKDEGDA